MDELYGEHSNYGFFVVWNPQGRIPMVRHKHECDAVAEARRLADCNPCQNFFVLSSVSVSRRAQPVTTTRCEPPFEPPF